MTDYLVSINEEHVMVEADNPMHAARLSLPQPTGTLISAIGEGREWGFRVNPKQVLGLDVLLVKTL